MARGGASDDGRKETCRALKLEPEKGTEPEKGAFIFSGLQRPKNLKAGKDECPLVCGFHRPGLGMWFLGQPAPVALLGR
jgi:hypothetical protein